VEGVEIRPAVRSDVAGILSCDPGQEGARVALVVDAVQSRRCLVAASRGSVVGFVVTTPGRFFGLPFVDLLVVSAAHRRRGIGRALLHAAVAATSGSTVWTSTNESNAAMRALLGTDRWQFSGQLSGLDDDDPELFFHT
jgi:ribosomal protein S18 acetylase RimI-like enzyme